MSGAILISDDLVNINIIIIHIIITITNIIVISIISISVIDHRHPHHGRHFHLLNFLVSIMGPAINQRANFFIFYLLWMSSPRKNRPPGRSGCICAGDDPICNKSLHLRRLRSKLQKVGPSRAILTFIKYCG